MKSEINPREKEIGIHFIATRMDKVCLRIEDLPLNYSFSEDQHVKREGMSDFNIGEH